MTRTRGDVLVYDERSLALHTLNAEMASVWDACDGVRSVAQIVILTGLEPALVNDALSKLSQADLLATPISAAGAPQSRRRLMKKTAIGVGVVVPTIASITTPAAAHHQSGQCHPGLGTLCTYSPTVEDCCTYACAMVVGADYATCGGVAID